MGIDYKKKYLKYKKKYLETKKIYGGDADSSINLQIYARMTNDDKQINRLKFIEYLQKNWKELLKLSDSKNWELETTERENFRKLEESIKYNIIDYIKYPPLPPRMFATPNNAASEKALETTILAVAIDYMTDEEKKSLHEGQLLEVVKDGVVNAWDGERGWGVTLTPDIKKMLPGGWQGEVRRAKEWDRRVQMVNILEEMKQEKILRGDSLICDYCRLNIDDNSAVATAHEKWCLLNPKWPDPEMKILAERRREFVQLQKEKILEARVQELEVKLAGVQGELARAEEEARVQELEEKLAGVQGELAGVREELARAEEEAQRLEKERVRAEEEERARLEKERARLEEARRWEKERKYLEELKRTYPLAQLDPNLLEKYKLSK